MIPEPQHFTESIKGAGAAPIKGSQTLNISETIAESVKVDAPSKTLTETITESVAITDT